MSDKRKELNRLLTKREALKQQQRRKVAQQRKNAAAARTSKPKFPPKSKASRMPVIRRIKRKRTQKI